MRRLTLFILLLITATCLAQKKQMQQAADYIKSRKDLDKAEKLMNGLLADSTSRSNPRVWLLLHEALVGQYEQGNEKLYLKQQYDTTQLFSTASRLLACDISLDSLEMSRLLDGQGKLRWRQKHAEYLNAIRPNLFNAGAYYMRKGDHKTAYAYFGQYIDCARQPLFSTYNYTERDALMPHAGYWAMYCGYRLGDAQMTMRHATLAERDTSMLNFVRQYEAEAFLMQKDTAHYVEALKKGFEQYPNFAYFFPRLMEYYGHNGMNDEALKVADRALSIDSTSVLFRFAKSNVLLNTGRYDECITLCRQLIAERDTLADAYYNIGLCYFNQAIALDKVRQRSAANKKKLEQFYRDALPYLEQFRKMRPERRELWLYPLYTIYLNLNMGDEFDEIDRLQKKYSKAGSHLTS